MTRSKPSRCSSSLSRLEESDSGTGGNNAELEVTAEERAALVEIFGLIELVLLGVQQYGAGHPETEKRLAAAVARAASARK